jgi:hypothetical protein
MINELQYTKNGLLCELIISQEYKKFVATFRIRKLIIVIMSVPRSTLRVLWLTYFCNKQTPWLLVRKRTIPTERPPLVDEILVPTFVDRGLSLMLILSFHLSVYRWSDYLYLGFPTILGTWPDYLRLLCSNCINESLKLTARKYWRLLSEAINHCLHCT